MKQNRIPWLALALLTWCTLTLNAKNSSRQHININREWKFELGDFTGAQAVGYNDKKWLDVNLPHNFDIPYFQSVHWYTGYGWYRKYFNVPQSWNGKRVFVEFEGAFRVAEIFVNGKVIGTHSSGYTGFSYDITDALAVGKNVLAVRLNNEWSASLAPRNGDHQFIGGIYRDVYLTVTDPVHVTWYGTYVTTPNLSKASGQVKVQTEVRNETTANGTYTLKTKIVNAKGKTVTSVSTKVLLPADSTVTVEQLTNAIKNPSLWHPQHPNLYKVVTTISSGINVLDTYETTFGFRWMEWTADKGFFLNGEHYYFRGANAHQDHAGWANAVTNAALTRDVRTIKDCGMDFIRGSHYPHDPSYSDACDSLGVLLWEENNFWGSGGTQRETGNWFDGAGAYPAKVEDRASFDESVKTSLREMIRIHRNHPSIIIWSMCNEPFFTGGNTIVQVREFLKQLTDLSHQLDPTRAVGIGGCQRGDIDKIGDVAGYNGDGARLFMNPGVPSVVTEYGATIAKRPGLYIPGWGDLQQEKYPWRSGEALWCAFDYGTRAGDFGLMGMVDYFRVPKNQYYWYINENKKIAPPEPAVPGTPYRLKLFTDKLTINGTNGTDDVHLIVCVQDKDGKMLSNSPDVTLQIMSGPGEFPTGRSITFSNTSDIYIRDGKAAIDFRSYYGGRTIIRASSPGLISDFLPVETLGFPEFKEGITPNVKDRPYTRFVWQKNTAESRPIVNISYQKPTRASSEAPGYLGNKANDKDSMTCWKSLPNDPVKWWQVDLENICTVSEVKLQFPEAVGAYTIELSRDNLLWEKLVVQNDASSVQKSFRHLTDSKIAGRFLRVTFEAQSNKAFSLSEIEVLGKPFN